MLTTKLVGLGPSRARCLPALRNMALYSRTCRFTAQRSCPASRVCSPVNTHGCTPSHVVARPPQQDGSGSYLRGFGWPHRQFAAARKSNATKTTPSKHAINYTEPHSPQFKYTLGVRNDRRNYCICLSRWWTTRRDLSQAGSDRQFWDIIHGPASCDVQNIRVPTPDQHISNSIGSRHKYRLPVTLWGYSKVLEPQSGSGAVTKHSRCGPRGGRGDDRNFRPSMQIGCCQLPRIAIADGSAGVCRISTVTTILALIELHSRGQVEARKF